MKPVFLIGGGGGGWWYGIRSVVVSSTTTTTTTTTEKIEYLRTERIILESITGEGTGEEVEVAALPAPSPCGREQRSKYMGIIGRDAHEFCLQGEGGG